MLIEAQATGMTSLLCAPTSAFSTEVASCEHCVISNVQNGQELFNSKIQPVIQKFLDYCSGNITSQSPDQQASALAALQSLAHSLGYSIVPLSALTTNNITFGTISTLSEANMTSILQTGSPSTRITIGSASPLTSTSSPNPNPPKPSNHAWIAGVVLGPLFAIVFSIVVFLLVRRKKQRSNHNQGRVTYEIHELHAESVKPKELEAPERTELPAH